MKDRDPSEQNRSHQYGRLPLIVGLLLLASCIAVFVFLWPSPSGIPETSSQTEGPRGPLDTIVAPVDEPVTIERSIKRDEVPGLPAEKIAPFPLRPIRETRPPRPGAFLAGPSETPPLDRVLSFLRENKSEWNLTEKDIDSPVVRNQHTSKHNGVTHIYLRQQHGGIEVYNGDLNANVAKDGSLINLNHRFVSNLASEINRTDPVISAQDAIASAAGALELDEWEPLQLKSEPSGPAREQVFEKSSGLSQDEIPAKLMFLPLEKEVTRLVWNTVLHLEDGKRWLDLNVDAETGEVLSEANWIASASYEAFPLPFESPSDGGRSVIMDPQNAAASPLGWHDTDGVAGAEFTDTRGNNVNAQDDTDANDTGGTRPDGGAGLDFSFALDLADPPGDYLDASIANLFYWNNICHDVFYQYGFDEPAGNFQLNNYGNGGSGGDPVEADAQDGEDLNNANFGTPPDGFSPRMQMFQWTLTSPFRDSSLDSGVIIHEYGHGISNRLTGGAANSSALAATQSGGMGEGWSDFFALCLTAIPSDTANTGRGIGTYLLGQSPTGSGIRPARYTTDTSSNDFTFGELAEGTLSVPHGVGFVWCTILWEVYWDLVDVHGFDADIYGGTGGNNLALQLVIDGLKLQPANPSFTEARDAIIQADQALNGGANFSTLWNAFARRGLGASAFDGGSSSSLDVIEAFDLPDDLDVTPNSRVTSIGEIGGPFEPASHDFTLTNNGAAPINWSVSSSESWLGFSASSGSLNAGQSVVVTATLTAAADSLEADIQEATIDFVNTSTGVTIPREFRLVVTGTADLIIGPGFDDAPDFTGFFHIPANPHGAAGPHSLLATANNFIDLRSKDGYVLDQKSLAGFFQGEVGLFPSFSRVYWDPHENRYVVLAIERDDGTQVSQFLIAVSKDDDPKSLDSSDWYFAVIDSTLNFDTEDHFPFFPKFGFDEEALYVFAFNYTFSTYSSGGSRLWIIDKGAGTGGLYQGGTPAETVHDPFASLGVEVSSIPARVHGSSGVGTGIGTFLVGYDGLNDGVDNYIQLIRIDDPLGSVSFTQEFYTMGSVEPVVAFPDVPQAGTPTQAGVRTALDGGSREVTDAVWRNGELWLTTTMLSATGADSGELATRWVKLETASMTSTASAMSSITIGDQGNITGEEIAAGTHTFYPSVAVNDAGDAKFAFCASGPNLFAGAYVAGRKAGDPAGTVRPAEAIKEGEDFYARTFQADPDASSNQNSWGEASAITTDPGNEDVFWSFNAYAMTRGTAFSSGGPIEDGRWGTAWGLCNFNRDLVINEVDSLTFDGDTRQFIEIFDGGTGNTPLDGFCLVLFNGTTDSSYAAFDLDGHSTDADGYFVIGNAAVSNVDYAIPDETLENGADAVALYQADSAQFSNGTPIDLSGELVDALVYDTGQADDIGILTLLNPGEPQRNEVTDGINLGFHSMQRYPNGSGGARNTSTFTNLAPTPGAVNDLPPAPSTPDLLTTSDSGDSSSDNITNDNTPTVAGTGGRPGATVRIVSDIQGLQGAAVVQPDGTWEVTLSPINDGNHLLTASADFGANSPALAVTIDTAAPAAPSIPDMTPGTDSGSLSTDDITNDQTPTFTGSKAADSSITLYLDGSPTDTVIGTLARNALTDWTITSGTLPEADIDIYATATDAAGNESGPSNPLSVTIDITPPDVTFGKDSGQADPANSGPVVFAANFSEPVEGFTNGDVSTGGISAGAVSVTNGPEDFTVSIAATNTEGTITASVAAGAANDIAGNASNSPTLGDTSVTLDSHGGTGGSATNLTFSNDSAANSGWLEPSDTDGFSFTLTEAKIVTIQTGGTTDTRGALVTDPGGVSLHSPEEDKDAGTGSNFLISEVLPPGSYVVFVTSEGGAQTGAYTISITTSDIPMLINEADSDTGANALEFVELFDGGDGNTSLDGMVLVFFRGDTEESYLAVDLDGSSTDADGYFVLGNASVSHVDLTLPDDSIRNDRSAVALYFGDDTDFPNGTGLLTADLLDALVSLPDGGSKTAQLDSLLLPAQPHLDESANGFRAGQSLQRIPDGSGGSRVTEDYVAAAPTPGQANELPPAPGVPDLESDSDSGSSSVDDLTNDVRPAFSGLARPGSLVRLSSDRQGPLGVAQTDATGVYLLASTNVDLVGGTHVITPTTVSTNEDGPSLTIEIDITAPDPPTGLDLEDTSDSGHSDSDDTTNDTTPTFSGDAETGSTVELFANAASVGSTTANSPWSITSSALTDDTYSITATATDAAGNVSLSSNSLPVVIDTSPPSVSIALASGQTSPALNGPALFTATFSEEVVGFEEGDITVGGTTAGAVSLSGDGTVFDISVATVLVEGSVVIGIPASVAEDIAGNPNLEAPSANNIVYLDRDDSPDGEPTDITPGSGPLSSYLSPDDVDTFIFTISALSYVTVQTVGPLDTVGEIRNSSDTLLNDPETDDDLGEDENFLSFLTLGAGTYTAIVSAKNSEEGDFELIVDATLVPPPPVINNNLVLKSQLSRKIKKLKKKIKKVKKKGNSSKAKKLKGKMKKLVKQLKSL